MPHMLTYVGARGLIINIKGILFLATKTDTRLCFCTVIGLYHAHIQNDKNALYVEEYGPQDSYVNMTGMFLSKQSYWIRALIKEQ